jgi:hypothetical protein
MGSTPGQPALFPGLEDEDRDEAQSPVSVSVVTAFIDRHFRRRRRREPSDKVACPACGCLQSVVLPHAMTTQEQLTGGYWRRRACVACQHVFATEESVATSCERTEDMS